MKNTEHIATKQTRVQPWRCGMCGGELLGNGDMSVAVEDLSRKQQDLFTGGTAWS